jgi:glycerophosphoryl diester phosphodiesterase
MKHRPDTPEGVNEIRITTQGEKIYWFRESPQLKRDITIYPEMLTPEQQERLNQIEKELVEMAYTASEETRNRTTLKGN